MTDEKWKQKDGHAISSDVTDANPSAYTAQPDHIYVGIDFSNKDSVCCAIRRGDLTVSISYDNEAREYIKSIIEAQQQPDAELRLMVNSILGLHPEYQGRLSSGLSKLVPNYEYEAAIGRQLINYLNARAEQKGGE